MAAYNYEDLKKIYHDFEHPVAVLKVAERDFSENNNAFILNDIEVELTCGFEASMATFCIYNVFSKYTSKFELDSLKKYVQLGSKVELSLGYLDQTRTVFLGVITRVNFLYENESHPYVQVTAMDIKGIMMSGGFAKQLKAECYSEAVKELFTRTAYNKMQQYGMMSLEIDDTPDKRASEGGKGSDTRTIEVTNESDYEFVVRAAKRYNYEFFAHCNTVYFRKAKKNKEILMEMGPGTGLLGFDIGYDITGLSGQVEVRGMDNGKGQAIQAKEKLNNKVSGGSHAKALLKGSVKVYTDPTISSAEEAKNRAAFLAEQISYRLGSAECKCVGLPELVPGRFIKITALGEPADNSFYLQTVKHVLRGEEGFKTYLEGKTCAMNYEPR